MDPYDISWINTLYYARWAIRGRQTWRRAQRTWQARRRQVQRRLATWREAREARAQTRAMRKETRYMPTEVEKQAMFKAMLPELDQDFVALLKAELRDTLIEEVMPEAEARARAGLEAEFTRRDEARDDAMAAFRQQVQTDADVELEAALERERRRLRREFEDRLEEAQAAQAQAEQRGAATDAQLLAVWRQLLPEGKQTYLFDAGIREVDLTLLQPILGRQGVAIAFQKAETSPRLVKVRVEPASWQAGTRFWLTPATPAAEEPRDKNGIPLRFIARF
jgi:hypothetical protein